MNSLDEASPFIIILTSSSLGLINIFPISHRSRHPLASEHRGRYPPPLSLYSLSPRTLREFDEAICVYLILMDKAAERRRPETWPEAPPSRLKGEIWRRWQEKL